MAVLHWVLIGYMFLFIHRPFEVWPWLGEFHLERVYAMVMLLIWSIWPGKQLIWNWQHLAYLALAVAVLLAWQHSPWTEHGQQIVEDWFKVMLFYLLLVTSVHDERGLKRIIIGFISVMGIYLLHSFREYLSGRHTFRMGITRMIGVDSTMSDPNTFAASIVFSLPFVAALWRLKPQNPAIKIPLLAYTLLSIVCILLTGSRSGLLGLLAWIGLLAASTRHGWLILIAALIFSPIVFLCLPASLQTRFETIVNPEAGSEIEQISGQGRIEGLVRGLELWAAYPFCGVGPGAWRPATESMIESHNLIGQIAGETGTLGMCAFLSVLVCFYINFRQIRRNDPAAEHTDLPRTIASAVGHAILLLLLMGIFGHNLFRYNWVWYGAFLIIARHVAAMQSCNNYHDIDDVSETY